MRTNEQGVEAYPLHWPPGRPRTTPENRSRANFGRVANERRSRSDGSSYEWRQKRTLTVASARDRLIREIGAFTRTGQTWVINPARVIVSTNVPTRNDGMPYGNAREPDDPGVAVYFAMKGQQHCLSCDRWDRVADNLGAIAKHLEAMRGQLRWGVADVAAMFAGFKALPGAIVTPAPMTVEQAARFMAAGVSGCVPADLIAGHSANVARAYRELAKRLHPDANGGQERPEWHQLQQAADVLRRHHGL